MRDDLPKKIAAAINNPAGAGGGFRRGPSWGRRHASYAPTQETDGEWAARAVIAVLEAEGRLIPDTGRLATLLPVNETRNSSAAVIRLEGPHEIFRFMVNQFGHQVEFGSAARSVLVDLRDAMGADRFDTMALSLLGEQHYEKLRDRFLRSWECQACETTIRVGARYAPERDAGAVCARCCKGHPEYVARLVKRLPEKTTNPT